MNKKIISKIAALALAGASAFSVLSVPASALNIVAGTTNTVEGNVYKVRGVYYEAKSDAEAVAERLGTKVAIIDVTVAFGVGAKIYIKDGIIYDDYVAGAREYVTTKVPPVTSTGDAYYVPYKYASTTNYAYLAFEDGRYYPNADSIRALGYTIASREYLSEDVRWSSDRKYFSYLTGRYSIGPDTTTVYIPYSSDDYDDYYYYRDEDFDRYDVYKVGSYYYPTLSSALDAADGDYTKLKKVADYSEPASNYFSMVTGQYYSTYQAALAASKDKASLVVTFSGYSASIDSHYYYDPYYYFLYNHGYYADYFNYYYGTYKFEKGDATLHKNSKRGGWKYLEAHLKAANKGSSVGIDMNDQTSVPKDILSAIDGRNIDLVLYMDNGAVFTINGKDVSSAKKTSIGVDYNTNGVPKKLVKAAYKKNDAVSSAQLSIDGDSFGFEADVTVKFSAKRADYIAKLYRYNSSRDTLVLVDSSTIKDNGKCTFNNVTRGGDYVVVIC